MRSMHVCFAVLFSLFLFSNEILIATGNPVKTAKKKRSVSGDSPGCKVDGPFLPDCDHLPFPKRDGLAIDQKCPNEGCAKTQADEAQNHRKNFLCAKGPAVRISFATMDQLQQAVDVMKKKGQFHYDNGKPPSPTERAKLKNLKTVDVDGNAVELTEGSLVSIEAFVLDAKHDDTALLGFSGEGVNCKNDTTDWNDIHIALGTKASSTECSSVTAEIIPHFRPAVWDRFDSNKATSGAVNGLKVKGLFVRIIGQLFFDGSHLAKPCQPPRRRTSWEIHPVYDIQVKDGDDFISFEDWAKQH
jgi:hypothetical protein